MRAGVDGDWIKRRTSTAAEMEEKATGLVDTMSRRTLCAQGDHLQRLGIKITDAKKSMLEARLEKR